MLLNLTTEGQNIDEFRLSLSRFLSSPSYPVSLFFCHVKFHRASWEPFSAGGCFWQWPAIRSHHKNTGDTQSPDRRPGQSPDGLTRKFPQLQDFISAKQRHNAAVWLCRAWMENGLIYLPIAGFIKQRMGPCGRKKSYFLKFLFQFAGFEWDPKPQTLFDSS